jgi:transposase
MISDIMHVLKTGARWRDCPTDYGPYTTVYNRFNRWSRQGVWEDIFYAPNGLIGGVTASLDSMHIKAHRSAGGAKGERWLRRSAGLVVDVPPRFAR